MKALVLLDRDEASKAYRDLISLVVSHLKERNMETETVQIGRGELAYCVGCFGCWVKKPGECVIGDAMAAINRSYMQSDAVLFVSPIVFGQPSASIKTAIERGLPNMLPFFQVRPDGSTMHPPRYKSYPHAVFVGEGTGATDEERALFSDIVHNHQRGVSTVVHTGSDGETRYALCALKLEKVGKEL